MNALVLYATRYGNTRRVAAAIADGLRTSMTVEVAAIEEADAVIPAGTDLVVIGGPTEGRHMTPVMREFLERLPHRAFSGVSAAAFDTRLDWPRWLSGSAAEDIRHELGRLGARVPIAVESFLVSMSPEISSDELTRARSWGGALASIDQHVTTAVAG